MRCGSSSEKKLRRAGTILGIQNLNELAQWFKSNKIRWTELFECSEGYYGATVKITSGEVVIFPAVSQALMNSLCFPFTACQTKL